MPLMSTDWADGIFSSKISSSHLVASWMSFTIVVMAICCLLATMVLEIGMDGVKLDIDVLVGISHDSRKIHVRQ